MNDIPRVSVIIPTFNRSHFIKNCILSVKLQSLKPIEIIVVDDGSTDNTFSILKNMGFSNSEDKDNEMKYIRTENKGISAARNIGIKLSRGEFIALLDSDDVWKRDKLKVQLSSLKDTGFKNMVGHTDEIWIKNRSQVKPSKKTS